MDAPSPLHGILVGCGFFGRIQLEAWRRVVGATISAVCDADGERVAATAREFGIARSYPSLEAALSAERPAFVDIATRPDSHRALTTAAAEAGAAVLCQKPLAATWEETVAVVESAETCGVPFMANENWRWQPWFREMKRLSDGAAVGMAHTFTYQHRAADAMQTPPFPNQPYFVAMPRFLLLETVIHFIDVARFLLGDVARVTARTRRVSGVTAGEDAAWVALEFTSGAAALIDASRCAEDAAEGPVFGHVRLEGCGGHLRLEPSGRLWRRPLFGTDEICPVDVPAEGYRGDSVRAALQHFVDGLRQGGRFETGGRDYLRTMRVVFAAYESAERGVTIEVRDG
jgi:D-apiose dehydrogenase